MNLIEQAVQRIAVVGEILPETHKGAFTKEDGEKVLDRLGPHPRLVDRHDSQQRRKGRPNVVPGISAGGR